MTTKLNAVDAVLFGKIGWVYKCLYTSSKHTVLCQFITLLEQARRTTSRWKAYIDVIFHLSSDLVSVKSDVYEVYSSSEPNFFVPPPLGTHPVFFSNGSSSCSSIDTFSGTGVGFGAPNSNRAKYSWTFHRNARFLTGSQSGSDRPCSSSYHH